jgi:immune inhibitor A
MEDWSLMDGGENRLNGCLPTPLNAFERYLFGWIDDIQVLDEPTKVTLTPLQDGGQAYKILGNNDNEYWIIEAIPDDDKWYMSFKNYTGTGMIVTHINTDIKNFSAPTMVNGNHGNPGITIVPADGRVIGYYNFNETAKDYESSMRGDPFPGEQNVTTLTDYWVKYGTIDKPIYDIVQNTDYSVSFKFMYTRGDVNGDGVINGTDIQYVINLIVSDQYDVRADVNEDGLVNGTDIQEIINIIVNGQ